MACSISAPTRTRCCTTSGRPSAATSRAFDALGGDADDGLQRSRRRSHADAPAPASPACAASMPPADVLARGEILPSSAEQDEIEFSWARQTARRVGTVVHEALERFGARRAAGGRGTAAHARAARIAAAGAGRRSRARANAGAERALTALRATLEDAARPLVVRSRPHAKRNRSSRSRACAARTSSTW